MRAIPDDMAAKVLAAAALFAERGLDGATMSDIAEATGIPRATLYYYFEGKEAVFACMCGLVLDRFEEVLAAALAGGGSAAERLGRVVRAQLGFCAEHPAAFLAMHLDLGRAARRAEMSQRILRSYLRPVAALLEEGAADGTMRPVTSPRVAAAALLGATTTAVEQALLSADEPSGPDPSVIAPSVIAPSVIAPSVIALYEPIMSLVLHGLGTAEEAPALYAEGLNS